MVLRPLAALFAVLLGSATAGAQVQNGSFEFDPARQDQIPLWFTPPQVAQQGVTTTTVFDQAVAPVGEGVARIYRPSTATGFGQILQGLAADEFQGRRIRLSALIRAKQLGDPAADGIARAQLWIRVDRENRAQGFFDNTADRPVIDNGIWNETIIEGDVHPDATAIYLGVMTFGHSEVLVDAVIIEDIGPALDLRPDARSLALSSPITQASSPLEPRGERNLMALGRATGLARWFSPSDGAVRTAWDALLVSSIPAFETVADDDALAEELAGLISPIVPGATFWAGGRLTGPPLSRVETPSDSAVGVHREHRGLYADERLARTLSIDPQATMFDQMPLAAWMPIGMQVERELVPGLWMRWPIRLPANEQGQPLASGTIPPLPTLPAETDRSIRLAAVLVAHGALTHFYPYADAVSTSGETAEYDEILTLAARRALGQAAASTTTEDFVAILRRLVAVTQDGHGGVYHRDATPSFVPPFAVRVVDGEIVVVRDGGVAGLANGDRVLARHNQPVADLFAAESAKIAGTAQWKAWQVSTRFAASTNPAPVTLTVESLTGEQQTVSVDLIAAGSEPVFEQRPGNFSTLDDGIVYVDLTATSDQEFEQRATQLARVRGIVFDLRGYPSGLGPNFLRNIIPVPANSPNWAIPVIRLPDRRQWEFSHSRWLLEPATPRFTAEVAFLMDGRAISYAESILGTVEAESLGALVGSPTAGANGNVVTIALPGEATMAFTGMRVIKPNGTLHHLRGVRPTVPVQPTREGIAAGRDEVLEAGLAEIHRRLSEQKPESE